MLLFGLYTINPKEFTGQEKRKKQNCEGALSTTDVDIDTLD